jgi:hypothetical protein
VVGISTFCMSLYSQVRYLQRRYNLTFGQAALVTFFPGKFLKQLQGRAKRLGK